MDGTDTTLTATSNSDSACHDGSFSHCFPRKPQVGYSYASTLTNRPRYLNTCLQRYLRDESTLCVWYGGVKVEKFRYGTSREPESTACYNATRTSPSHNSGISAKDAKAHIGEEATVCGRVASQNTALNSTGSPTFIDLDSAYPQQVLTILVWGSDKTKIGWLPSKGEHVCVSGQIREYNGTPEIVVNSGAQLTR